MLKVNLTLSEHVHLTPEVRLRHTSTHSEELAILHWYLKMKFCFEKKCINVKTNEISLHLVVPWYYKLMLWVNLHHKNFVSHLNPNLMLFLSLSVQRSLIQTQHHFGSMQNVNVWTLTRTDTDVGQVDGEPSDMLLCFCLRLSRSFSSINDSTSLLKEWSWMWGSRWAGRWSAAPSRSGNSRKGTGRTHADTNTNISFICGCSCHKQFFSCLNEAEAKCPFFFPSFWNGW